MPSDDPDKLSRFLTRVDLTQNSVVRTVEFSRAIDGPNNTSGGYDDNIFATSDSLRQVWSDEVFSNSNLVAYMETSYQTDSPVGNSSACMPNSFVTPVSASGNTDSPVEPPWTAFKCRRWSGTTATSASWTSRCLPRTGTRRRCAARVQF